MNMLKKLFPLSFKVKRGVLNLLINLVIQAVVALLIGALIGILASVPVIGVVFAILGSLVDVYLVAGIVIALLYFFDVIKK